jgi:sensor domain CHASE-containing protein
VHGVLAQAADGCAGLSREMLLHHLFMPLVTAVVGLIAAYTAKVSRQARVAVADTREAVERVEQAVNGD